MAHVYDYLENYTAVFERTLRRSSFAYFILTVLPKFELAPHILEWTNEVQMYRLLCIKAARYHAKSYTMSYAYPLWKAYRYDTKFAGEKSLDLALSREGMIITNEIGLATSFLGKIKDEIESNEILREVLYPGSKIGWGAEQLNCKNGAMIMVKSYGSRMRGYHPTWMVIDDFLDDHVLHSSEQKAKFTNYFHSVPMNMIHKDGQVIVVGTPFVVGDLYDDIKIKNGWMMFEYPAIFPDGTVLWETEHTYRSLMAIKERIGSVNFSRELLVTPISDSSSVFQYEIYKNAYTGMDTYTLVNNLYSHPMKDTFTKVAVGMDFAWSASARADYVCFYVLAQDTNNRIWLLHVYRARGVTYDRQLLEAKRIYRDFNPDVFVVESNQAQVIFAGMMEDAGLPVMRHTTGSDKYSLTEGIPAIAVLFENSLVRLPRGDEHSRDITDTLGMQLTSFCYDPDKGKLVFVMDHDDDAMAFWQGIRGLKYSGTKFGFSFM
jgi:hypothetical protein